MSQVATLKVIDLLLRTDRDLSDNISSNVCNYKKFASTIGINEGNTDIVLIKGAKFILIISWIAKKIHNILPTIY